MCEQSKELSLKPFSELIRKTFIIPYQQRGYKWTPQNVEELLNDLKDFINTPKEKKIYCLQPLALVDNQKNQENSYIVLDGQQRLTTLYLLYVYLNNESPYTFEYKRDFDNIRAKYLSEFSFTYADLAEQNIDFYYINRAYEQIKDFFSKRAKDCEKNFRLLLNGPCEKSLQVIWYIVDENKQHTIFRNLNSGKIQLTNTDLIKALLLNRVSGLPQNERLEAAATFDIIEREMQNDSFWYMFNGSELRNDQTRMDFLFNLVAGCKQSDYDVDPRCSFRRFFAINPDKAIDSDKKLSLSEKWKEVRQTFLRLKDMYDDTYCYHYIGFLTYNNSNGDPLKKVKDLLNLYQGNTHSQFIEKLKEQIQSVLTRHHSAVDDYRYDQSSKEDLRLLFVMHNIETILQRYTLLRDNQQLSLQKNFEKFPFDLLHKQSWDIEHIASNTDSDFKNKEGRQAWLDSIKFDLGDQYPSSEFQKITAEYDKTKTEENFNKLYKAIMQRCEIEGSIKDESPDGKDKMQIGNITLLDSHTNRSYHNALFPRKRRTIIVADGLSDNTDEEKKIVKLYIPPCTRQVFTKAYTKGGDLSLNTWTQKDADAYVKDMEQKLSFYFSDN